jgi:hypothetical protein
MQDLDMILEWMNINRLEINWSKTNAIIFTDKLKSENIKYKDITIPAVEEVKLLGIIISKDLTFKSHITSICKKINSKVFLLNRNQHFFPYKIKTTIFKLFILPIVNYCSSTFMTNNIRILDKTYKKAALQFLKINLFNINLQEQIILLAKFNLHFLHHRLFIHFCKFIIQLFRNNRATVLLNKFLKNKHKYESLRNTYTVPSFKTKLKQYSFVNIGVKLINGCLNEYVFKNNFSNSFIDNNYDYLFDKFSTFFYERDPF